MKVYLLIAESGYGDQVIEVIKVLTDRVYADWLSDRLNNLPRPMTKKRRAFRDLLPKADIHDLMSATFLVQEMDTDETVADQAITKEAEIQDLVLTISRSSEAGREFLIKALAATQEYVAQEAVRRYRDGVV